MNEEKGENEFLNGREAVQYLRERWKLESYSESAFRVYRMRHEIKPDLTSGNTTFWRRETLDKIPQPRPRGWERGKKRGTKKRQQHEDNTEEVA